MRAEGSDESMSTAERRTASEDGAAAGSTHGSGEVAAALGRQKGAKSSVAHQRKSGSASPERAEFGHRENAGVANAERASLDAHGAARGKPLWVEEPARRPRMPDPVRTSAVRAVLIVALTLIQAVVAFLCTLAGSWLAFPMVLSSVASTVVATWGVLDVWVTRQVWNQRHGVMSTPSSTARRLRRERRRARRQARAVARDQERIRRRGGRGQLSHT
jgi:hypothetical protein